MMQLIKKVECECFSCLYDNLFSLSSSLNNDLYFKSEPRIKMLNNALEMEKEKIDEFYICFNSSEIIEESDFYITNIKPNDNTFMYWRITYNSFIIEIYKNSINYNSIKNIIDSKIKETITEFKKEYNIKDFEMSFNELNNIDNYSGEIASIIQKLLINQCK